MPWLGGGGVPASFSSLEAPPWEVGGRVDSDVVTPTLVWFGRSDDGVRVSTSLSIVFYGCSSSPLCCVCRWAVTLEPGWGGKGSLLRQQHDEVDFEPALLPFGDACSSCFSDALFPPRTRLCLRGLFKMVHLWCRVMKLGCSGCAVLDTVTVEQFRGRVPKPALVAQRLSMDV